MEITGKSRQKIGKAVKSLRKEGLIPAVVFGNEIEPQSLTLNRMEFAKLFGKAGETSLVDLKTDGGNFKVLINEVQHDPIRGQITHASFYKPNLKEKTEVAIPVEVVGEDTNALVKGGEGVVLKLMNEITVKALPADLPEAFTVDVAGLSEVGAGITVGQLNYDHEKVEIMHLDIDELVVKIDKAIMEQTAEDVADEVSEQEAIEKLEALREKKPEDDEEGVAAAGDKAKEKDKN